DKRPAGEARLAAARELIDSYAEELVAAADEPDRFASLKDRVERLLASIPEGRTPAVEIVLLQAEYQRAESLALRWLEDRGDSSRRTQAEQILRRIAPLLARHERDLAAAAEKSAAEIDEIKSEKQRSAAERQAQKEQAIATRAAYFC